MWIKKLVIGNWTQDPWLFYIYTVNMSIPLDVDCSSAHWVYSIGWLAMHVSIIIYLKGWCLDQYVCAFSELHNICLLLETNRSLLRYVNTIIATSLTDSYVSRCAPEECNKILTNVLWYANSQPETNCSLYLMKVS